MIKVLIDTNILISAVLNPEGIPYQAFEKAVVYPYRGLICSQKVEEFKRIFLQKFPEKIQSMELFFKVASENLEIVPVPKKRNKLEDMIRDINDGLILRAAVSSKAGIILTGDKDFLESGIVQPQILTAAEFIRIR